MAPFPRRRQFTNSTSQLWKRNSSYWLHHPWVDISTHVCSLIVPTTPAITHESPKTSPNPCRRGEASSKSAEEAKAALLAALSEALSHPDLFTESWDTIPGRVADGCREKLSNAAFLRIHPATTTPQATRGLFSISNRFLLKGPYGSELQQERVARLESSLALAFP